MEKRAKSEVRKRAKQVIIRLSDDEYTAISERAEAARLTVPALLRKLALDQQIQWPVFGDAENEKQFMRKWTGLTTNINQVTRLAHSEFKSGQISEDIYKMLTVWSDETCQLLNTLARQNR